MHEERVERFGDERDRNDQSKTGQDSPISSENAQPGSTHSAGASQWMAEAQEEAARRRAGHSTSARYSIATIAAPRSLSATGPLANDHSDEALFLQYQQGDDQAFFTIYERYKASIYAYCAQALLSAGLSRETVEDTFQDVFLRLVQYRDTFTGGDFKPWIFTVTRHSCLSIKKRTFRQHSGIEYIGDGVNFDDDVASEVRQAFAVGDDPLERMSQEEQTGLLLAAIAKLPEEFREALMLSEYEGLTYDEIGRILGASLSTIRIRIFRAKARLRKMLLPVLGDPIAADADEDTTE